MVDLSTSYLGLSLKNPLVASASPLSKKIDSIKRLEDAGVSAVVLYSLFEEQIVNDSLALNYYLNRTSDVSQEAFSYFPDLDHYNVGPEAYLEHIRRAKQAVDVPIIASLNGVSRGGWVEYAEKIEAAGADALELNLYYLASDPGLGSQTLEENHVALVQEVRGRIRIPLAVKLSPFVTALPQFARRLADAGANGLVLFNRFYQPDLDIENLEVKSDLVLSSSDELRLPLRWIAILYGRVAMDLALTSGVHTGRDVIKAMMAGASVAMTASALVSGGAGRAAGILEEVSGWMETYEYESIRQMTGSMSQKAVAEPAAYERANYMKALVTYDYRVR